MEALTLAKIVHRGQKRRSGADFTDHVVTVRQILIDAGVSDRHIHDAALLHDSLEDGNIAKEYLAFRFGSAIADIVDILSKEKIWHTSYIRAQSQLHVLELAWERYPEATMIKIADRLHNLQTLDVFPLKKRREYLQETRKDLIPLFRRILQEGAANKFHSSIGRLLTLLETEVTKAERHLSIPT